MMSSSIDPVPDAVVSEEKPQPPPRRFPPPCWTQEEALALIEAYRERWYALRRGYLRTADWDAVAATVTSRCPDASPAKTSAQCRHKMEKLRQRYRAEKQRSLACPTGRFFSSWFFFDNMDAMENGTTVSAIRSNNNQQLPDNKQGVPVDGYALKTIIDQNLLKLKINSRNGVNPIENSNTNFMFNHGVATKTPERSNFPNGYYSYMDMGANSMKAKRMGRVNGEYDQGGSKGGNFTGYECDEGSEYNGSSNDGFVHVRNHMAGIPSSRRSYGEANNNLESRFSPPGMSKMGNNVESRFGTPGVSKLGKKVRGVKRGRDSMEEMVLSIKLLGEGFIKMEKMKMEMAKEVEQMRMEMEMKRNEMILESQKQIVNAFVKVLSEVKKNNEVKTVSPES